MRLVLKVNLNKVFSREALSRKKKLLAEALLRQTQERIRNGGDDEITFQPLDFARPDGSKNSPLYWTGKHLYDSLESGYNGSRVWLKCTHPSAILHQLGTVGKGGKLPTIRPKKAKALFIPKSMRGVDAVKSNGKVGSLKGLESGVDYIFVKKVDIYPREFIRLSRKNREEIAEIFAKG